MPKLLKPLFTATSGGFSGGAIHQNNNNNINPTVIDISQVKKRKLEQQKHEQHAIQLQEEHKNKKRNYLNLFIVIMYIWS